jgi:hypothetical protein
MSASGITPTQPHFAAATQVVRTSMAHALASFIYTIDPQSGHPIRLAPSKRHIQLDTQAQGPHESLRAMRIGCDVNQRKKTGFNLQPVSADLISLHQKTAKMASLEWIGSGVKCE